MFEELLNNAKKNIDTLETAYGTTVIGRRINLKILYENKDISADLQKFLLTANYDDVMSGTADSLSINLQDVEGLWKGDWLPDKGAKLTCSLIINNWNDDNTIKEIPFGIFELDTIEANGPPSTVNLKAISIPCTKEMYRDKYRAWEKVKLSQIIKDVAADGGLEVFYDVDSDTDIERAEQIGQSNLEFLEKICKDNGLALKISTNKLVVFDEYKYEQQEPVLEINKNLLKYTSYRFRSKLKGIYKACHVKYQKVKTKELIEYTFYVPGQNADTEGRILEINQQVESIAEAEKLAKKSLRNKNKDEITASLSIPGGYEFAAGCVYKLTGWQKFDGNYICEKVSHSIGGGYSVSLELRRVLNGY